MPSIRVGDVVGMFKILAALLLLVVPADAWFVSPLPARHRSTHSALSAPRMDTSQPLADKEALPRRPPAVYDLMDPMEIESVHRVSDALYNVLDRNGDDSVSKEDLGCHLLLARYTEASVEGVFALIDVNSDGEISREELREAFMRYPALRNAPAMGTVKKSERNALHTEAEATFSALDLNGDGVLSIEELQEHFSGAEGSTYSPKAVESIFSVLDRTGDGKVTRSKFRGGYVRYRAMRLALGLRSEDATL